MTVRLAARQLRQQLRRGGRAEQLGRVRREPPGGQDGEVRQRRERGLEQERRRLVAEQRVGHAARRIDVEVLGEGRAPEVELDERHRLVGERDRVREVDGDRRLALAGHRARDDDDVELARHARELERAAQDPVGLEVVGPALGLGEPERRLGDAGQRAQAVLALEALDVVDAAVDRLEQEHEDQADGEPEDGPERDELHAADAGGRRRHGRAAEQARVAARDRAQRGEPLERVLEAAALRRAAAAARRAGAGGRSPPRRCCRVSERALKRMYWAAKAFASVAARSGIAVGRRDPQDVRVLLGLDR